MVRDLGGTFDEVADGYESRPDYPERVFDILTGRCGLGPGTRVLEIGPGTGQATIPMLQRGASVTAVEPGASLARRLRERAAGARLDVIVSRFEEAVLPAMVFDLAASATAFHWVDTDAGLDRCAAALRSGGWLALWWSIWGDHERPDPLHEALDDLLDRHAPELRQGPDSPPYLSVQSAIAAKVAAHPAFGPVEEETILWEGRHDPVGLRQMFATFSGWIALPEPRRTELLDDLERLATERFGGVVVRPYRTVLYCAPRL